MTTIAYNHKLKQVAVDSRLTSNGSVSTDSADKTIKTERGLYIFCGIIGDNEGITKLKHNDSVDVLPDGEAYLITDDSLIHVVVLDGGICKECVVSWDDAIGSGYRFAIAAMDHGKSAKDAVKYAATRDIYTGGKVHVFNIGESK